MPFELVFLVAVFAVAIIGFALLKRPMYECMLAAFIVLAILTAVLGAWEFSLVGLWGFIWKAMKDSSLYVIIVFIVSAHLLSQTTVIDDFIAIILAIFGRLRGGAGFVAIIGSTYMGSLSGSGPGNVATTGVFTIPAMKRSGFPPELAANVEAHSSTMGNMIPPAGMIATAYGILTLYFMCRYYKVEPMKKEDIPPLGKSLKNGWKAIFLPIIVFVPFLLTSKFEGFFKARLGAGASSLNNSLLLFIPALIVVCAILLSDKKTKQKMTLSYMTQNITEGLMKVVPTAALVFFAYCVSNVLVTLGIEKAIGDWISAMNMPLIVLALILPLFTAVLGMLIPGSTQVKIFGGIIISIVAAAGGSPFIACGILPCICGAMHGVTPPYCACVYTGMGIADAELGPTLKNCMVWIALHYVLSVIVMMGWLPLIGMIS